MTDASAALPRSRAALLDLERALGRLEGALARRGTAEMTESLRAARADYARLDAAARQVETRLGEVIARLKSALEG